MKPGTALFAVNSSGRVFALSRDSSAWQEFEYLGIEFKRIAAAKNVIWAIGGDHQIYVYVYGIEVPIREGHITVVFGPDALYSVRDLNIEAETHWWSLFCVLERVLCFYPVGPSLAKVEGVL